jgi:hypothetical protein
MVDTSRTPPITMIVAHSMASLTRTVGRMGPPVVDSPRLSLAGCFQKRSTGGDVFETPRPVDLLA